MGGFDPTIVREFSVFREPDISADLVWDLAHTASKEVDWVGRVEMRAARQRPFPKSKYAKLGQVPLLSGRHTILFTGRPIPDPDKRRVLVDGLCLPQYSLRHPRRVVASQSLVYVAGEEGYMDSLVTTIHEIGHSLGLDDHCAKDPCVMMDGGSNEAREEVRELLLDRVDVFCDRHADMLVQNIPDIRANYRQTVMRDLVAA